MCTATYIITGRSQYWMDCPAGWISKQAVMTSSNWNISTLLVLGEHCITNQLNSIPKLPSSIGKCVVGVGSYIHIQEINPENNPANTDLIVGTLERTISLIFVNIKNHGSTQSSKIFAMWLNHSCWICPCWVFGWDISSIEVPKSELSFCMIYGKAYPKYQMVVHWSSIMPGGVTHDTTT